MVYFTSSLQVLTVKLDYCLDGGGVGNRDFGEVFASFVDYHFIRFSIRPRSAEVDSINCVVFSGSFLSRALKSSNESLTNRGEEIYFRHVISNDFCEVRV